MTSGGSIRVKAFADLRKLVPPESDFPADGPVAVETVIQALALPPEKVTVIFINGRHAEPEDAVHPGDTLSFFPPVGGG